MLPVPQLWGAALWLLEQPDLSVFCGPSGPCPFQCGSLLGACIEVLSAKGLLSAKLERVPGLLPGLGDTEGRGHVHVDSVTSVRKAERGL